MLFSHSALRAKVQFLKEELVVKVFSFDLGTLSQVRLQYIFLIHSSYCNLFVNEHLQLMFVCKQWQQMISSCSFITTGIDTAQVVYPVNTTVIFLGAAIRRGLCAARTEVNVTVYLSQGYHLS